MVGQRAKKGLSTVFAGFTIAGGLTLQNSLFGKSDYNIVDLLTTVESTLFCVVMLIWLRKE